MHSGDVVRLAHYASFDLAQCASFRTASARLSHHASVIPRLAVLPASGTRAELRCHSYEACIGPWATRLSNN
eukprot:5261141-Pleurochrysis_carterae.AAC.1